MSLTVVRDRPDRRRAYGINAPLHVSVAGGERLRAPEWSHLGLVVPSDAIPPIDGGLVQVVLHVDYQGFAIDVPARARLDETTEDPPGEGLTRLEFVDLDTRSREIVQRFVDDYVRGRAVPAGDALLTLDAPHEPIDIKPDPVPPSLGRRIKPYLMTAFYLALGLATFIYLGVLLYAHLVRLEVRTGVVTRPIEVVRSNEDGTIVSVHRADGDRVAPGGLIARLADPKLDEEIARAEAQLEAAVNETKRARKRLKIDEKRLREYRLIWDAERRSIEREAAGREKDWRRALRAFHASVALWDENAGGTTSKWDHMLSPLDWAWDEFDAETWGRDWGRACLSRLKPREVAEIEALRAMYPRPQTIGDIRKSEIVPCAVLIQRFRELARLKKRWRDVLDDAKQQRRIDTVSDTRLYNGHEFVVDLDVAKLGLDQAKADEAERRAMLAARKAQRARSSLRTARGGRIVEIAVAPDLPVTRGQTIAVLELDVRPTVDAYLTQEEVTQVGLGDVAEVFLPALDGAFPATVVRVDRTAGHRDDRTERHVWREDGARSALVRLALELEEDDPHVASGLPATVLFARRSPDLMRRRATRDAAARLFPEHVEPVGIPRLAPDASAVSEGPQEPGASEPGGTIAAVPEAVRDLWRETLVRLSPSTPGGGTGADPAIGTAPGPSDPWSLPGPMLPGPTLPDRTPGDPTFVGPSLPGPIASGAPGPILRDAWLVSLLGGETVPVPRMRPVTVDPWRSAPSPPAERDGTSLPLVRYEPLVRRPSPARAVPPVPRMRPLDPPAVPGPDLAPSDPVARLSRVPVLPWAREPS